MTTKRVEEITNEDAVQIVMHGAMVPAFIAWLKGRGFTLKSFPAPEEDLPTFMIGLGEDLINRVKQVFSCDHSKRCCPVHNTHSDPHVGCILR